jgi:hypothetical protein
MCEGGNVGNKRVCNVLDQWHVPSPLQATLSSGTAGHKSMEFTPPDGVDGSNGRARRMTRGTYAARGVTQSPDRLPLGSGGIRNGAARKRRPKPGLHFVGGAYRQRVTPALSDARGAPHVSGTIHRDSTRQRARRCRWFRPVELHSRLRESRAAAANVKGSSRRLAKTGAHRLCKSFGFPGRSAVGDDEQAQSARHTPPPSFAPRAG